MTAKDEKLLAEVNKVEQESAAARNHTAQCLSFAEDKVRDGRTPEQCRRGEAAFLAANYAKKGKKQRQEELVNNESERAATDNTDEI